MLEHVLHDHLVPAVHPHGKRSLLHPVVHLAQQNLPIPRRRHIFLVESLHSFKALSHQSHVQGVFKLLTAALVALGELQARTPRFIQIEGLP